MFAKSVEILMIPPMKVALWLLPSCILTLFLSSCGNHGSTTAGNYPTPGPFDSRGNYVEEWADNPAKWRKPGSTPSPHDVKSDEIPVIAMNDQPPQNSIPLAPRGSSSSSSIRTISTSRPQTQRPEPEREPKPEPVVVKSSPKPSSSSSSSRKTASSGKTGSAGKSASSKPKSSSSKTASTKSKPKPKTVRYTVKKGDSLSTVASRNGTSVTALRKANGLSGSVIRPGQSLSIPK